MYNRYYKEIDIDNTQKSICRYIDTQPINMFRQTNVAMLGCGTILLKKGTSILPASFSNTVRTNLSNALGVCLPRGLSTNHGGFLQRHSLSARSFRITAVRKSLRHENDTRVYLKRIGQVQIVCDIYFKYFHILKKGRSVVGFDFQGSV